MGKLSRRKIANYVATQLLAGDKTVYKKLAAYLVQTRRVRELPLIERDIEAALLDAGVVRVCVETALPISGQTRKEIERFITKQTGATSVQLDEAINEDVIGGMRLKLPGRELDSTIEQRLKQLMKRKVTE